jgi:hypothetical protein
MVFILSQFEIGLNALESTGRDVFTWLSRDRYDATLDRVFVLTMAASLMVKKPSISLN